MTASPFDWAAAQQAMVDWALAATELSAGSVVWAGIDGSQVPRPYVMLQLLTGVVAWGQPEHRKASATMIDLIQVTAASTQTYGVSVDDVPYTYDATVPSDTIEDIRDALLVELGALSNITVEAVSTDQIRLTGSAARPHFHAIATPAGSIVKTSVVDAIETTTYQPGRITLRVHAHTDSVTPTAHARELIYRCIGSRGQLATRQILSDAGVPMLEVLTEQDTTAIVGAEHESSYFADFSLGGSLQVDEYTPWFRTVSIVPTFT